ncbi:MAG TPA: hypothetical protein PKC76_17315 [Saprospiraceae bacterium]|nr:hypothetical protein [Saprospiraceae bacterium]HMP25895.1 hypothetical protein [Saprospiraceae bacterium]
MNKCFATLIALLLIASAAWAQKKNAPRIAPNDLEALHTWEDTLTILSYAVVNDSLAENRFAACRTMIPLLVKALKTEHSFQYPFERLKSVSIQYPQDSSFRIFTWQLYVSEDDYRYYGAIQMNTPELKLFPLIDRSANVADLEQDELSPDQWYGSVYYNLRECKGPQGKYYLLFGFDGLEFFRKRKLVDVLHFRSDGQPVFGAPVFVHQEKGKPTTTKKRVFIEYSAAVSVRFNYDEALELLIFDHLIPLSGQHGEGMVMVPDGSYQAYTFQKGLWYYQPRVLHEILDEAPRPYPVLDQRDKDIFGGKGKN